MAALRHFMLYEELLRYEEVVRDDVHVDERQE